MRWSLALVLTSLAIVSACGSGADEGDGGATEAPLADALAGRRFASTQVTGRDLVAESRILLTFEDGRLAAIAGCNTMSGDVTIDGEDPAVLRWSGDAAMTLMGCEAELMAQDEWLNALLSEGVEVALDGDDLTLTSGEVTIDLLDQRAADPDRSLIGVVWTLDAIIEGQTASSVAVDATPPTLEFFDDGSVAVFGGCNRGRGEVVRSGDGATATFGPLALTRMLCPDGGSDLEAQVLGVLDGEVSVDIEGSRLTLRRGDRSLGFRAD